MAIRTPVNLADPFQRRIAEVMTLEADLETREVHLEDEVLILCPNLAALCAAIENDFKIIVSETVLRTLLTVQDLANHLLRQTVITTLVEEFQFNEKFTDPAAQAQFRRLRVSWKRD